MRELKNSTIVAWCIKFLRAVLYEMTKSASGQYGVNGSKKGIKTGFYRQKSGIIPRLCTVFRQLELYGSARILGFLFASRRVDKIQEWLSCGQSLTFLAVSGRSDSGLGLEAGDEMAHVAEAQAGGNLLQGELCGNQQAAGLMDSTMQKIGRKFHTGNLGEDG